MNPDASRVECVTSLSIGTLWHRGKTMLLHPRAFRRSSRQSPSSSRQPRLCSLELMRLGLRKPCKRWPIRTVALKSWVCRSFHQPVRRGFFWQSPTGTESREELPAMPMFLKGLVFTSERPRALNDATAIR